MPQLKKKYKFKELKCYASTEWLIDNQKKYRQVFDKYEVNGLIAKGTTLSIAFPAGDGTINSYQFSLNGAVQAISMVYEQIKSLRK